MKHWTLGMLAGALIAAGGCASSPESSSDGTPAQADAGLAETSPDADDHATTMSASTNDDAAASGGALDELDPDVSSPATLREAVERRYVIGPTAAFEMGYRVDWQHPSYGYSIKQLSLGGDSVLTLDENNILTRIRDDSGDRVWRIPVVGPVVTIHDVVFIPRTDEVYVLAGSEILVLDAASGGHVSKQKLKKVANTSTVPLGQFLVYGSRDGQVVWHSYMLGTVWAAYQVAPSITLPPIYSGEHVVVTGVDGRVMSLRVDTATQVWNRRALAPIVAEPAAGGGAVFVASLDQHLRAYDIATNRSPLWEYLTESPLDQSPVLIGDRVYQQVPSAGLVCLEAQPIDRPGGVVVWTAEGVRGNVLTQTRRGLLVWNDEAREASFVDPALGAVVETLALPQVDTLHATSVNRGRLYAIGDDGRVVRLVPRN